MFRRRTDSLQNPSSNNHQPSGDNFGYSYTPNTYVDPFTMSSLRPPPSVPAPPTEIWEQIFGSAPGGHMTLLDRSRASGIGRGAWNATGPIDPQDAFTKDRRWIMSDSNEQENRTRRYADEIKDLGNEYPASAKALAEPDFLKSGMGLGDEDLLIRGLSQSKRSDVRKITINRQCGKVLSDALVAFLPPELDSFSKRTWSDLRALATSEHADVQMALLEGIAERGPRIAGRAGAEHSDYIVGSSLQLLADSSYPEVQESTYNLVATGAFSERPYAKGIRKMLQPKIQARRGQNEQGSGETAGSSARNRGFFRSRSVQPDSERRLLDSFTRRSISRWG